MLITYHSRLTYLLLSLSLLGSQSSLAFDSKALEDNANQVISSLYQKANNQPTKPMPARIDWFSAQFKNKPYLLGALGEGPDASFDQFPRYRTDSFDCDTYVNTVLSLALANSLAEFKTCINKNRYLKGQVNYVSRKHFNELDWNIENQQRGIFKDVTLSIKDKANKPVALMAQAFIDKPGWYAHKTLADIRLQKATAAENQKRLNEMKAKGAHLPAQMAKVPYLPLSALFQGEKANRYLFSQIPHGAIIEIIRPNWNLREEIGTNLLVSHLGFAIWRDGKLYFREASSEYMRVVDVSLIAYLRKALASPTIKGINVQVVVPASPSC